MVHLHPELCPALRKVCLVSLARMSAGLTNNSRGLAVLLNIDFNISLKGHVVDRIDQIKWDDLQKLEMYNFLGNRFLKQIF